jgi:hypothetical protein
MKSVRIRVRSGELHCVVMFFALVCAMFGINDRLVAAVDTLDSDPVSTDLTWSIVPSPHRPGVTLYGVAASSPTQAWAVGDIYSPLTPIIYRWNGISWKDVSVSALSNTSLRDVITIAANDVWAIGYQENGDASSVTVTEHWDGVNWTRVSSPNPSAENYLSGVAAIAANDVWAVGYKQTNALYSELILHWDGDAWTVSSSRGGAYRVLTDVAAVTSNDVWAIGYQFSFSNGYQGLAMHWDGVAWADVTLPRTDDGYTLLNSVTAIATSDVWVVGNGGVNPIKPVTVHWDGIAWSYVANAPVHADYAFLKGVTALSANDVWAVGYFTDHSGIDRNLVQHWDGVAWTRINVPAVHRAHNQLWGIAPDRAGGLWTAGNFTPTDFSQPVSSLVLHGSP